MSYREYGGGEAMFRETLKSLPPEEAIKLAKERGLDVRIGQETMFGQVQEKMVSVGITTGEPGKTGYELLRRIDIKELPLPVEQQEILNNLSEPIEDAKKEIKALGDMYWAQCDIKDVSKGALDSLLGYLQNTDRQQEQRRWLGSRITMKRLEVVDVYHATERCLHAMKLDGENPTSEQLSMIEEEAKKKIEAIKASLKDLEKEVLEMK